MKRNHEADEINNEDLEAAAQMWDDLVDGTFYQKQEEATKVMNYWTLRFRRRVSVASVT